MHWASGDVEGSTFLGARVFCSNLFIHRGPRVDRAAACRTMIDSLHCEARTVF